MTSVERYDAQNNTWIPLPPMKIPRAFFGLCSIAGDLYASGGVGDEYYVPVERYSPSSNTWTYIAPMPGLRRFHCACAVGHNMYVLGGVEGPSGANILKTVFRYDSRTEEWCEVAPMPEALQSFAAVVIEGQVYVFGGLGKEGAKDNVYRYTPKINKWISVTPMPDAKCKHSVCIANGLVFVMGGCGKDKGTRLNSVLQFNPSSCTFNEVAPLITGRSDFGSFAQDGFVYVVGGITTEREISTWDDSAWVRRERRESSFLKSMERYDPRTNSWSIVGEMGQVRFNCSAHVVEGGGLETEDVNLFDFLIARASGRTESTDK
jgi:N-acetylneuraminic acid mutarotase